MNAVETTPPQADNVIPELYSRLNSKDEAVRTAAIAEGAQLPTEQLIALAKYEADAYRAEMKQVGRSFLPLPLLGVPLWIIGLSMHQPIITILSFLISGAAFLRIAKRDPSTGRESIAAIINESDDPRVLTFALEIMNSNANDQRTYRLVRVAVKKLLPKIPLDGSIEWKPAYNAVLVKQLDFYDIELATRILKVFAVYGNQATLDVIDQFAEADPGNDERKRIVRDNARKAKKALVERLKAATESTGLLRPAASSDSDLLQPSTDPDTQDVDKLLRSSSSSS